MQARENESKRTFVIFLQMRNYFQDFSLCVYVYVRMCARVRVRAHIYG